MVFIPLFNFRHLPKEVLFNALCFLSPNDLDLLDLVNKELALIISSRTQLLPGRRLYLQYTQKTIIATTIKSSALTPATKVTRVEDISVDMEKEPEKLVPILRDPKLACIGNFFVAKGHQGDGNPLPTHLLIFKLLGRLPPLEKGTMYALADASTVLKFFVDGNSTVAGKPFFKVAYFSFQIRRLPGLLLHRRCSTNTPEPTSSPNEKCTC